MSHIIYLLFSYFMGCIMSGNLVARLFGSGIVLHEHGSGNIGARNAGRVLGKKGFVLTFVGDALKGALVVGGAIWLGYK